MDELDKELENRGYEYVRYANDCLVLCKNRKNAERTMENIVPLITGKLFLKVNPRRMTVSHISKIKYLSYGFYWYKGGCRMRVCPRSVVKMRNRTRELATRGNEWNNQEREEKLRGYAKERISHYRHADMEDLMRRMDE